MNFDQSHQALDPLLNAQQAADMLAIGKRKLWELTNRGEIPHLRIGRAVRYDADDLRIWINDRKRSARKKLVVNRTRT